METTVNCYTNGTYRGNVTLPLSKAEIEKTIEALLPGENTVISYNNTEVYNSNMTPLYCNGEIKIAYRRYGKGEIVRQFSYV